MSHAVLFVHGITEIGGAERELLAVLERLPRYDYRPLVVCPEDGPLVEELGRRGIGTRSAPFPPWRKLSGFPKRSAAVRALREIVLAERPALVHVNDIWWVPQTLRALTEMEIPIVAHARQEIERAKARLYELHRPELVLAVSRGVQQALALGGVSAARLQTMYSGVAVITPPGKEETEELRRHWKIPAGAPLLGTVANLFPRKGHDVMLRALPDILAASPDAHYIIVGSGDSAYEQGLRTLIRDLDLERRVRLVGFQPQVDHFLAAMDLYVHPALLEGFGIAVLEAMAAGRPVVATRTGGLPELLGDGEAGVLVEAGDPQVLARAVSELLRDPRRAAALGEAGRMRARTHFSVDAMMEQLTTSYGALLARPGAAAVSATGVV